jgi:hypothetical protein
MYASKALDTIYPKPRGTGETPRPPFELQSVTGLSIALQRITAPLLEDLTLRLYANPDIERNGKAFCSMGTLQSIDLSGLDHVLSSPSQLPHLRNVAVICGSVSAPAPFQEFILFLGGPETASHGSRPYYSRAPKQSVGVRFEDSAAAFLRSAFPLGTARRGVELHVVKGR